MKALTSSSKSVRAEGREVVDRWPEMRNKLVETCRAYVVDADELVQALQRPTELPVD